MTPHIYRLCDTFIDETMQCMVSSMHGFINECITGLAEIILKLFPGFKLLGNKNKGGLPSKITQFLSVYPLLCASRTID